MLGWYENVTDYMNVLTYATCADLRQEGKQKDRTKKQAEVIKKDLPNII